MMSERLLNIQVDTTTRKVTSDDCGKTYCVINHQQQDAGHNR